MAGSTWRFNLHATCIANSSSVKFGTDEEKDWPCTYGMNEKGGMGEEEFLEYVKNSIRPLYPHSRDAPGKQVMFKADSGPGRKEQNS